ncbi:MAG: hypothetical protein QOK36_3536 [Gaiellales bacterium]|jgi:hypothetical protein|nr:hypothetical protein [Gaiellales bacterium]
MNAISVAHTARREWTAVQRAALVSALAIAMGALFVTTYTLALGDPIPRRIEAAVVGNPGSHVQAVNALERVADHSLTFRRYPSLAAARQALHQQKVYAALDLTQRTPRLYLASAAGASVARVLERVAFTDARINVIDTHPLAPADPNGVDIFYLVLVSTIVGFIAVFQVRANAGGLQLQHWWRFVVLYAVAAAFVLTLVTGPVFHRLALPFFESWGIVALMVVTASSFAATMIDLVGRWAILPTWLFFVVLGNTSSGGAVSPALLPRPFALVSEWLPSGAAVTSLRNAVYFHPYQHAQPIAILATWAAASFAAMLVASHRAGRVPA